MLYILDWMDEIKARLQSEDYGKHLMGVEDLLQKHSLLESDIHIVGERVKTVNGQANRFVDADFPDAGGMYCVKHGFDIINVKVIIFCNKWKSLSS